METKIPSPVTSNEEQAAGQAPVILPNGKQFEQGCVYREEQYSTDYLTLYLKENRKVQKQIDEKLASCEKVGILSPISFVYPASYARELGFHVMNAANGMEVTDDDELANGLLIMDGNTRFWAWTKALNKANGDANYKPFDLPFTVERISSKEQFMEEYTEINKVQKPTSASDYGVWYMSTSENAVVKAYKELTDYGIFPKAAGYAVVGEEIVKKEILKALAKKSSVFDKVERLDWFLPIVKQVKDTLSAGAKPPVLMKQTAFWKFIGSKVLSAKDHKAESEKFVGLFDNLRSKDLSKLNEACKLKGSAKEIELEKILSEAYSNC